MLEKVEAINLTNGATLVPCAPPEHLLLDGKLKSGIFKKKINQSCIINQNHESSTNHAVSNNNSVYMSSLFDIESQEVTGRESADLSNRRLDKFVPNEDDHRNLVDTSSVSGLRERSVEIQTLSVVKFESYDPELDHLTKLGCVGKERRDDEIAVTTEHNSQADNTVVFHVGSEAVISQPEGDGIIEISEVGRTRVLVTDDSSLRDVYYLKKEYLDKLPRLRGKTGKRTPTEALTMPTNPDLVAIGDIGVSWFTWRESRVDMKFILKYHDLICKLVEKHRATLEEQGSTINIRVAALLEERKVNDDPGLQTIIDFFSGVYVKYVYIITNFRWLSENQMIDILRRHHSLDNNDFTATMEGEVAGLQEEGINHVQPSTSEDISSIFDVQKVSPKPKNSVATERRIDLTPGPTSIESVTEGNTTIVDFEIGTESLTCSHSDEIIGDPKGSKVVQFFYQNPTDGMRTGFPAVQVATEEEVRCVVALVTERAEEFSRKYHGGGKNQTVQYTCKAIQARSLLRPDVRSHILQCFTKKGMKELRLGYKKRNYPVRKDIVKIANISPSEESVTVSHNNVEFAADEDCARVTDTEGHLNATETPEEFTYEDFGEININFEEEVPTEHVPSESEIRKRIEEDIFGDVDFGEFVRKVRPSRLGLCDDRKRGRGGRNEILENKLPDDFVREAVGLMLDKKDDIRNQTLEGTISLPSLFKKIKNSQKKKRKYKKRKSKVTEDFKCPKYLMNVYHNNNNEGMRRSTRISKMMEPFRNEEAETERVTAVLEDVNGVSSRQVTENSSKDRDDGKTPLKRGRGRPQGSIKVQGPVSEEANGLGSTSGVGQQFPGEVTEHEVNDNIGNDGEPTLKRKRGRPKGSTKSSRGRPKGSTKANLRDFSESTTNPSFEDAYVNVLGRDSYSCQLAAEMSAEHLSGPRSPDGDGQELAHSEVDNRQMKALELLRNTFEMVYTRRGHERKINKLLEKHNQRMGMKKYLGFENNPTLEVKPEPEMKVKAKWELKRKDRVLKKASVSREEADLVKELLRIGDSAVAKAEVDQPTSLISAGSETMLMISSVKVKMEAVYEDQNC